jgi:hypothetical protein
MSILLYSSDNSEKALNPGDFALNLSSGEIIQMTEISSAIFGNDKHLEKLTIIGNILYNKSNIGIAAINGGFN